MSKRLMVNIFVVLLCLLVPVFGLAEPTYDDQGDLIRPNSEKHEGRLNGIGEAVRGVVSLININDTNYKVDEDTIYRNGKGKRTSLANFSKGMYVEYFALENLVTKMSMSVAPDENVDDTEEKPSVKQQSAEDLRLENGVWKN